MKTKLTFLNYLTIVVIIANIIGCIISPNSLSASLGWFLVLICYWLDLVR